MRSVSLRTRLTVLLALAVLVALGTAAAIVDWRADSEMRQRFDASLLSRAQSLAALTQVENGQVMVDTGNAAAGVFPGASDDGHYEVTCGGRVVARTSEVPQRIESGESPFFTDVRSANGRLLRIVALRFTPLARNNAAATAEAPACTVRYALNRGPLDEILHTLDFILLGCLLGACALVILATPLLVRRGLRPLTVLDHAMAGIGPDAPGRRLPASDTTELVPLVSRFNEVLARMDAGLAREKQFASGLAHEFRTRLAELRTLVDVETRYPSGRDIRSLLGEIGALGRELEATVTALLQLTRIESELEQPRNEDVPVAALLARVCARQQEAALARNVDIVLSPTRDIGSSVVADPALLEIVLDNLVGNAIAYAPSGTTVDVRHDNGAASVANRAPSLLAEDLDSFGKRFWRKGDHGSGHAGLGLALAAAAARALRMTLSFELADGVLHATLRWATSRGTVTDEPGGG